MAVEIADPWPQVPGIVARSTQKDRVYFALRQALMYGTFAPGATVTVRSLGERFAAGTMPVRDAVQRLVAEQALELLPSGRLRIPSMDAAEIDQLMDLRLLLECHAAREAAAAATPEAIAAVREAMLALERVSSTGMESPELLAANFRFHFSIYTLAGSAQLIRMIEGLWLRFGPLLIDLISRPEGAAYVADEHQLHHRLLHALELRDADFAGSAMRRIIERTRAASHGHPS